MLLLVISLLTRGPVYCGTIDRIEDGTAVIEYREPLTSGYRPGQVHFVDVEPRRHWDEGESVCWR